MPMDGIAVGFVTRELHSKLWNGRVDKITQPERDTVVILIRAGNSNYRLLLCASANNARLHLTDTNYPNPLEPPALCMLLRKQLMGARVIGISQFNGDRIAHVDFEAINEMGDHVRRRLVLEIMGRYSNLMLLDENGRIMEAARHVGEDMSRVRQIMPGLPYEHPPAQDKLPPREWTEEDLRQRILREGEIPLAKAIANAVSGVSMVTARELADRILPPGEEYAQADSFARLADLLQRLPQMQDSRVLQDENGDAADVFPFPYLTRDLALQQPFESLSRALEQYYGSRDNKDRLNQKSASMVHMLKGQVERCEKKLALQEEELASAQRMEEYRMMGEILNANLYQLKKGMTEAVLYNWYDPEGKELCIPLDIQLTPSQNAQRYFKKYQKARSARQTAGQQRDKTLKELDYLEGMLLDVGKCVGESELEEIREELVRTGYAKKNTNRHQQRALPKSKPYRYESADGIEIHVGKNAMQNDRMTQAARPNEMWLHVKDMPGSHVLIRTEGEVPHETLKQAAMLAAWYSKGQRSSLVPVDYTLRRYVKKPGGAAPGKVIYTNQKTAYMTVEESDIRKIRLLDS